MILILKFFFRKIQYVIIRKIESYPYLNLLILNNLRFFKFLLPHDKDFLGMKLILNKSSDGLFLDIGANIGASTMSIRSMGFNQKIYLFEPNYYLFKRYLINLKSIYKNIKIFNLALGNKNKSIFFYIPYYKKVCIHYFSSFDKNYIKNSISATFGNIKFNLKKKKILIVKYDDLKIKEKVSFIKIDVEGFDLQVISGLEEVIKKHKPILLIEYNEITFYTLLKVLKNYEAYIYNINNNSLDKVKLNNIYRTINRFDPQNLLSVRNIYFLPLKN